MKTTIQGIPCVVSIFYTPGDKRLYHSHAYLESGPPDEEDFEIAEVRDRKGYPAQWLADKITDEDVERIREEYLCSL